MKIIWHAVAVLVIGISAIAQVAPPKRVGDLQQRFEALRCAMVTIDWEETAVVTYIQPPQQVTMTHTGSGFYTSADGEIVTASHVVGNRSWSDPGTGMVVTLATPESWNIQNNDGKKFTVKREKLEQIPEAWGADLARIKTGVKSPCWIKLGNEDGVHPGQHVITLGYPGLAAGSLTIYSGIVSARLKSDLPVGISAQNKPVVPANEFFRVEMPISPGLSGAAVIDDKNRAIAVVTAAGASTGLLDALIQLASIRDSSQQPGQQNNYDWTWAVGQLARNQKTYSSPGYGDSVPATYLKKGSLVPTDPGH